MQTKFNEYKKLVLNTSDEIPFTRIKNTILCTDAIKTNKKNILKYQNINQNNLDNSNSNKLKVVFHDKTFKEDYEYINSYNDLLKIIILEKNLSFIPKREKSFINSDKIIFDSDFENGNLRMVIELEELNEYDLLIRPEYGGMKTYQWFFFSVIINKPLNNGIYDNENVLKFNLINMEKDKSQFNSQCPVVMYDCSINKWSRNTFNVFCYNNGIKNEKLKNEYQSYFTLTFSFKYQYNTKYYFAYCYPYTYTQLRLYLNTLNSDIYKNYIKFGSIGLSCNDNNIPYIIITNFLSESNEISKRKCILLTSRIHPGETSSSYVIQGVINFLINPNNSISKSLRNKFIFKIVPMINVDGVIFGNYRYNLKGRDLNRMWVEPDNKFSKCVLNIKKLIRKTLKNRDIYFYCDFHGHSSKSNFFLYGCQKENVQNYEKVFMRHYQRINNNFDINNCINKINQSKIKTGRAILKNEFGIDLSYCLETSMTSYTSPIISKKYFPFSIERYKKIGNDFCLSLNNIIDESKIYSYLNENDII